MNAEFPRLSSILAGISIVVLAACAKSSDSGSAADSTAASVVASAPAADSGMAGMDHSNMPGMNKGPAQDADHEFLRKMSDHHEGIILMMDAAMKKANSATAKADAKKIHDKQHPERDKMVGMIKSSYNETYMPMAMQSAKAMNDDLQQKSGAAYDRTMYGHIVMHHQEALKMIDDFVPRLKKAEVKQMAEKMRADQQKEIQEFQRKQGT